MEVTAIKNFEHYGRRKRGDVFEVSDVIGKRLHARGLVSTEVDAPCFPLQAVGAKLSALPAVQVLPQTIVKKSKHGKKPAQSAA